MKRICVFAGSKQGARPSYTRAARALAKELLDRDIGLVFGGSSLGLMGILAAKALEGGGEVIGILPQQLLHEEAAFEGITELHIVRNLYERKTMMHDLSDAFIALPGGLGTLDETLDMLTLLNVGAHAKPVGLLNVQGFYDPLIAFVRHAVVEGFIAPDWSTKVVCEPSAQRLVARLLEAR